MRRTELIKLLEKNGWVLLREGGGHTIYIKGHQIEAIPRHRDINEITAKAIIKRHKLV